MLSLSIVSGGTTPNPQSGATSCDFESSSICGFMQDHSGGDKFDWLRDNQGTTSGGTGPSVDHTLGTRAGRFYFYAPQGESI